MKRLGDVAWHVPIHDSYLVGLPPELQRLILDLLVYAKILVGN